ncbi:YbjN domain-containing protein [Hyphomonas sp.]|jgi:hypothetical protein|uniref:YbjN domain-containing protein n=1 Tax=Hyphomonas sp. TaxID=87 RepID=UPI0032D95BAD
MMLRLAISMALAAGMAFPVMAWPISPENAATVLTRAESEEVNVVWLDDEVARIDAKLDSYNYSVRMMRCDETKVCSSVMLFATFDMVGTPDLAMYEKTNLYNENYPFGRAFILPGSDGSSYGVGIDYTLDLSNEHNFDGEDMVLFGDILAAYISHMSEED